MLYIISSDVPITLVHQWLLTLLKPQTQCVIVVSHNWLEFLTRTQKTHRSQRGKQAITASTMKDFIRQFSQPQKHCRENLWPLKKWFTFFPFPSARYYFILQNMETFKCFYMGQGPTVLGAVHTHQETNELLMLIKWNGIFQFTHTVHTWLF